MRFYRAPAAVQFLFKSLEWRVPVTKKIIYLTFDDGPVPEITSFVLKQLAQFQAKATFFCVGENVSRYPEIAGEILQAGHKIGNHTHNHLKGWETETETYLQNVKQCQNAIEKLNKPGATNGQKKLFRPPYGKISRQQIQALAQEFRIIMWDVLTYDFDKTLQPESCLETSISLTRPGSVVVFHDSLKARKNLEYVLPRFLAHFHQKGYRFETL